MRLQLDSIFSPATYVVAPSSSGKKADYYTTGSNDNVQIQAALNALPATGGTVLLLDGTYTIGATITMTASQRLIGMSLNSTILTSSVDIDIIRMGNRQSDGSMRNWMELTDMTVNSTSASQTKANVKIDGGGRGTSIKRVSTGGGKYGFELMDLDRCYFEDISANNPKTAGIFLEVGLENTYGTVTFVNCDTVLGGTNNTFGFLVDKNAAQLSPNAPDRINFIGCMMFMSGGLTGCVGFYNKIQMTATNFIGCLFEQNIRQFRSDGSSSQMNFQGCSFLDSNNAATDIAYLNASGSFTFRDCRFQQATNGFNGVTGSPVVVVEGRNSNQGNITNLFAGSFGAKMGTDTVFAGDGTLASGLNNQRYGYNFGQIIALSTINAPGTDGSQNLIYVDQADSNLKVKFSNGTTVTLATH